MTGKITFSHHSIPHLALAFFAICAATIANHAAAQKRGKDPASVQAEQTPGVVNINTATAEELMRLPGVGPAKANAILALRERIKRFPRVAAIMRVRGIGRKTFARLKPMLSLEGPTTLLEAHLRRRKASAESIEVASNSSTQDEDRTE